MAVQRTTTIFNFYYSDKACAVGTEIPVAPELRLYPNPTSSAVTLEWNCVAGQEIRLNLYNSLGKLILDQEFDNSAVCSGLNWNCRILPMEFITCSLSLKTGL
jgi:hypothetical protein